MSFELIEESAQLPLRQEAGSYQVVAQALMKPLGEIVVFFHHFRGTRHGGARVGGLDAAAYGDGHTKKRRPIQLVRVLSPIAPFFNFPEEPVDEVDRQARKVN
jgi:hypothetical protein